MNADFLRLFKVGVWLGVVLGLVLIVAVKCTGVV